MKRRNCAGILLLIVLLLAGCTDRDALVFEETGIRVRAEELIWEYDDHGGFHGDGLSCRIYQFPDDSAQRLIGANPHWKELPLSQAGNTLLYGRREGNSQYGPYLDGEKVEIPRFDDGFWLLLDRQEEGENRYREEGILDGWSLNFTLALYDSGADLLYVYRMDT